MNFAKYIVAHNLAKLRYFAKQITFSISGCQYPNLDLHFPSLAVVISRLEWETLIKNSSERVSVSGQITEIFLTEIVIYLSIKRYLFCSLIENQDRSKKFFPCRERGLFQRRMSAETHINRYLEWNVTQRKKTR